MSNPRLFLSAFAAAIVIGACAGNETPPLPPEPTGPTPEELEALRQDSIRRAQAEAEAEARREEERRAREAARRAERARQALTEMVFFDYDEAVIRSDTESKLRAKLEILRSNVDIRLRMEGHADERGTSEYNIALGDERADAVIRFFSGFGLGANRFSSVSYGEERPLAQGSDETAWARNRRVEFVITAGGETIRP